MDRPLLHLWKNTPGEPPRQGGGGSAASSGAAPAPDPEEALSPTVLDAAEVALAAGEDADLDALWFAALAAHGGTEHLIEELTARAASDPAAWWLVAGVERREGRFDEAKDAFDEYLDAVESPRAAYERATLMDARGKTARARKAYNDLVKDLEKEDADAELAVGLDFRNFPDESEQAAGPTLYPTVVTGCRGELRIVTTRCRGPVLPVSPYSDGADLFTSLDHSAGPDGQVGAAATLIGGQAFADELRRRFTYVLSGPGGPFDKSALKDRLRWGGGPASWTFAAGPDGMRRRFGPVDLTHAFSRDTLTSRARWSSRKSTREEAAAAAK